MSYVTAAAALRSTIAGVAGIKKVLSGQPSSAHNLPLAFTEADTGEHRVEGQKSIHVYRIALSVLVAFQDNVLSEDQLAPFINSIPDAIDRDPSLGIGLSEAKAISWTAGYLAFGNPEVVTRRLMFTVQITEKYANPWTPGG